MNIGTLLNEATASLEAAGIGTARLDTLVMLEDELKRDRAWLLSHLEFHFQEPSLKKLKLKLERRKKHEPLAYIRKKTEFYGREFFVDRRVLQPRPESEAMIEEFKWLRGLPMRPSVADVGTGSGALAITAKLERPGSRVIATDIDSGCIKVAARNAKKHQVDILLMETDLLRGVRHGFDVILANLPYVPARYQINQAARHEPDLAIFGGGDGLECYRRLFFHLVQSFEKPKYVLTESLPNQHINLSFIAQTAGYTHRRTNDFVQVFESLY